MEKICEKFNLRKFTFENFGGGGKRALIYSGYYLRSFDITILPLFITF